VAVVALRTTGLRQVTVDDHTMALRLMVDRRDWLGRARTDTVNRLHALLLDLPVDLVAGGANKHLTAPQARTILASVRPRDVVGRTRRQLAAELITELAVIDKKIKQANAALTGLIAASHLQRLHGVGPSNAPGCSATSATSPASPAATTSRPVTAPHPWMPPPPTNTATGSRGPATGASTGPCTSWPA
jgi:transposase